MDGLELLYSEEEANKAIAESRKLSKSYGEIQTN